MATRLHLDRQYTLAFDVPGINDSRSEYTRISQEVNRNFKAGDIACLQPKGPKTFFVSFKSEATTAKALQSGIHIDGTKLKLRQVPRAPNHVTLMDAPYELSHEAIRKALSIYGEVKNIEYVQVSPELGAYYNGDRRVTMFMIKRIPNILNIDGFDVLCWYQYEDSEGICEHCSGEHMFCRSCKRPANQCFKCKNSWYQTEDCNSCPACQFIAARPKTAFLYERAAPYRPT